MALHLEGIASPPQWTWDMESVNIAKGEDGVARLVFYTAGESGQRVNSFDGERLRYASRAWYEEQYTLIKVLKWSDLSIISPGSVV